MQCVGQSKQLRFCRCRSEIDEGREAARELKNGAFNARVLRRVRAATGSRCNARGVRRGTRVTCRRPEFEGALAHTGRT